MLPKGESGDGKTEPPSPANEIPRPWTYCCGCCCCCCASCCGDVWWGSSGRAVCGTGRAVELAFPGEYVGCGRGVWYEMDRERVRRGAVDGRRVVSCDGVRFLMWSRRSCAAEAACCWCCWCCGLFPIIIIIADIVFSSLTSYQAAISFPSFVVRRTSSLCWLVGEQRHVRCRFDA